MLLSPKLSDLCYNSLKNMSLRDSASAGSWQSSWDRHVAYAPRDDNQKIAQFR